MLIDGLNLIEGSSASNLTIASGASFPSNPSVGELFYKTTDSSLYISDGSIWTAVGSAGNLDGFRIKEACRAATTENISLGGLQSVDGVVLDAGNRVLVKNQSTASQNGIYVVSTVGWTRSTDFDQTPAAEVNPNDFVFVSEGITNGDTGWVVTSNAPIQVGTTAITFAQFTGANAIPGGPSTAVQFNSAGVFQGTTNLTWNEGSKTLQVGEPGGAAAGRLSSGAGVNLEIAPATTGFIVPGNDLLLTGGQGARAGGSVQIAGGQENTNGYGGGNVNISGGAGFAGTGYAGNVNISGGIGAAAQGEISFKTSNVTRLTIQGSGAWLLGGANGSSGQVLTSNGTGAAPTWQAGGGVVGGSTTQLQYNLAGSFAGMSDVAYPGDQSLLFGTTLGFTLRGSVSSGNATTFTIKTGASTGTNPGTLFILGSDQSTNGQFGGRVEITSGNGLSSTAGAGVLYLGGGYTTGSGTAGTIRIAGGQSTSGTHGEVVISTFHAGTSNNRHRLRIDPNGAWYLGANSGTSTGETAGTSGQVLTTNGTGGPPTWQTSSAIAAAGTLTGTTLAANVVNSSLTSVGTLSSLTVSGTTALGTTLTESRTALTATATTTLNCALGNIFVVDLAVNISSLLFTNVPASGRAYALTALLTQGAGGSKTITWPVSIKWTGNSAPVLSTVAGQTDIVTLVTSDGGTTWYGMAADSSTSLQASDLEGTTLAANVVNSSLTSVGTLSSLQVSGNVVASTAPTLTSHLTNKQYVDTVAQGLSAKPAVRVATTTNLTATYNNGTAGVGATLTFAGALPDIDGVSLAATNGVLVKNQSTGAQNGRYNVTQLNPGILTRCALCDESTEIPGSFVFVNEGSQAGTGWVQTVTNATTFVIGTDPILVSQFSSAGSYTGGAGLTLSGTTFNIGTVDSGRIVVNADNIDLGTVGSPITDSLRKITTDAYGRVSASSAVVEADLSSIMDTRYVNTTGDTMTGQLALGYANPSFTLNAAAAAQTADIFMSTAGSFRWRLRKDSTAESGSNAGSDFSLISYSDASLAIVRMSVNRATGAVSFPSASVSAADFTALSDSQPLRSQLLTTAGFGGVRVSDQAGTRVIELISCGSTSAGAYGMVAGEAGINTAIGSNLVLSTGDTARIRINNSTGLSTFLSQVTVDPISPTLITYLANGGSSTITNGTPLNFVTNSTVVSRNGAASTVLTGIVVQPLLAATAVGGTSQSNVTGFTSNPLITSSATGAYVSIIGANTRAERGVAADTSSNASNFLIGSQGLAGHMTGLASSATSTQAVGVQGISRSDVGTITTMVGFRSVLQTSPANAVTASSTDASFYDSLASLALTAGGTTNFTNFYGIRLRAVSAGAGTLNITNRYGVFQEDSAATNVFQGNTGVGTAAPVSRLSVQTASGAGRVVALTLNNPYPYGSGQGVAGSAIRFAHTPTDAGSTGVLADIFGISENESSSTTGALGFATRSGLTEATTERMRIDSEGNVGIGTTSPLFLLDVQGTGGNPAAFTRFTNTSSSTSISMQKSRGTTVGSNVIVQNNDVLGSLLFNGANGTGYDVAAIVRGEVDGTPGASADMPGRLLFMTSADGSASPAERMRIDSSGNVAIGMTTQPGIRFTTSTTLTEVYDGATQTAGNAFYTKGTVASITNATGATVKGTRAAILDFSVTDNNGGDGAFIGALGQSLGNSSAHLVFGRRTGISSWAESMRINASGQLLVGGYMNSTPITMASSVPRIQAFTTSISPISGVSGGTAGDAHLDIGKSRTTTPGTFVAAVANDTVNFGGFFDDGTSMIRGSMISTIMETITGTGNIATRMRFYTRASGAGSATERMTIMSNGNVSIGSAADAGGRLNVEASSVVPLANFNATSTNNFIRFQNSGTAVADVGTGNSIFSSGGVSSDFGMNVRTGNLVFGTAQTERMRVLANGRVLVARSTDSGLAAFQVAGGADISSTNSSSSYGSGEQVMYLRNTSASSGARGAGIRFDYSNFTGGAAQIDLINGASNGDGSLSFGTRSGGTIAERLAVNGSGITVTGTVTETSTIRVKENVRPLEGALDKVLALRGVVYDMKDHSASNQIGLIAEEVHAVVPNVVYRDEEGEIAGVQYARLVAVLIEGMKEQEARIKMLEAKLAKLVD